MEKVSTIIGRAIVESATGTIVAHVRDVITDTEQQFITGFVIRESGLWRNAQIVPFDAVQTLGPDALIVPNVAAVSEGESSDDTHTVRGAGVLTEDGQYLGVVDDVYFDGETGDIHSYDISAGMLKDAYVGKSQLPAKHIIAFGHDVVFVDAAAAGVVEGQVGGVKKAVESVAEKTKDTVEGLRDQGAPVVGRLTDGIREKVTDVQTQLHDIAGRKDEFRETAKDALGKAGQQAESTFTLLRERVQELTRQGMHWLEERRIQGALGRPVTRIIYDRQDAVIMNAGDIITHAAIDRARAEGALDMMLSSVAHERPNLLSNNIRA